MATTTTTRVESRIKRAWRACTTAPALLFCIFSVAYFTDFFLRASRKRFWYDELFTVYLCRLPDFKHTWAAVVHGADYNPPLVYLLTRGVERIFGEGLIASRLPEMVGVWLFCICLYLFVSRRVGRLPGLVAALFPLFTGVPYFAYEARPHGLTLGFCGLALVCWQKSNEERSRFLWPLGFGLSLTGALLAHVYAIYLVLPFALVELYYLVLYFLKKDRRPNWSIVAAIVLSLIAVLPIYLSLVQMYRATIPSTFAAASHSLFLLFFEKTLGLGVMILVLAVGVFAVGGQRKAAPQSDPVLAIPRREILLAIFLTCIPIFGLAGAKLSHGPFIYRYFLSAIAGDAIFLGFASSRRTLRSWVPGVLAGVMLFLLVGDLGSEVYERVITHRNFGFSENPLAGNAALLASANDAPTNSQDILILRYTDYFYLYQYAPPKVSQRLFFAAPSSTNLFLGEYRRLAALAHVDVKATTFAPFLATHKRFLVYGGGADSNFECGDCVQEFLSAGYTLTSAHRDNGGVLYEYSK